MRHRTALLCSILAVVTAVFAVPGPASAAVPGFRVQITELPGSFTAGADTGTVTVVASTDVSRRCQKVRWSMLLTVNGISLDQVKVDRVEEDASFPLSVQAGGDTARLTDVRLDPGELCRGRTVTARYRLTFDPDVADGQVTLQAEAYDTTRRLLQLASATREVVNGQPQAEPSPTQDADGTSEDEQSAPDPPAAEPTRGAAAAVPVSRNGGDTNLLGVGLVVGAVLIFLGVGLLLRLRLRTRRADQVATRQVFYPGV